jgi:hypothetical protein
MKNIFLVAVTISLSLSSAATVKRPLYGKIQEKRSEFNKIAHSLQKKHLSSKETSNSHAKASASSDGTVFYFPYYMSDDQTCSSGDEYLYIGNILLNSC